MDNFTLYMHVNKTNGKRYVGITSTSTSERWKRGGGYRAQRRFYNAILHYGWDGFDHIVVEAGLSKEEAERKEAALIKKYNANNINCGYNIENGGVINKISEEQKALLSAAHKGHTASEETKRKMSRSHLGLSTAWLAGRKASAETKKKMSEALSGALNPRAKAVYQYDLDGNLVAKYEYMELAKKALNAKTTSHISNCCTGKRGKAYGFMWSYELENKAPYTRLWKGGVIHG